MSMITRTGAHSAVRAPVQNRASLLSTIVVLFKLRIVLLLVFASVGGALLASHGRPTWGELGLLLLTGAMSAAGASALNQYIERGHDGLMKRTARRPLVTGEVNARVALIVASGLVVGASAIALLAGNPALAFWLALGAFIYVGIYTIWLKPRSVLNVVIGGGAGSAAVISGGAAVGAWTDPGVLILAALLFTWSPIHFWALALAYRKDYGRAGVPMLPVVSRPGRSIFWMLTHAVMTGLFGLLLALHSALGWLYLAPVALATVWLLRESVGLLSSYTAPRAMSVFKVSNIYLSVVLLAVTVASVV